MCFQLIAYPILVIWFSFKSMVCFLMVFLEAISELWKFSAHTLDADLGTDPAWFQEWLFANMLIIVALACNVHNEKNPVSAILEIWFNTRSIMDFSPQDFFLKYISCDWSRVHFPLGNIHCGTIPCGIIYFEVGMHCSSLGVWHPCQNYPVMWDITSLSKLPGGALY